MRIFAASPDKRSLPPYTRTLAQVVWSDVVLQRQKPEYPWSPKVSRVLLWYTSTPVVNDGPLYERIDVCQVVARVYPDFGISRTAPGQHSYDWAANARGKNGVDKEEGSHRILALERVSLCQFLNDERRQTDDK